MEKSKSKSRTPDYNLNVLNKRTEERGKVGAAWINEDGSISIALNLAVTLVQDKFIELRLFPNDWKKPPTS